MKIRLALLACTLAGCLGPPQGLDPLPDSRPLAEPMSIDAPGPLLHAPSDLRFEESYGDFRRAAARSYDTAGLDIGLAYTSARPDCPIAATFYLYTTPRMDAFGATPATIASAEHEILKLHYAQCKTEIASKHPALEATADADVAIWARGRKLEGFSYTYREAALRSELRLFILQHRWFLKYRFAYPQACEADAHVRIEALVSQLPWADAR